VCTFTAGYASGAVGTFSLSRVAFGHANSLRIDLFCENGTASFDLTRPAEFSIIDTGPATPVNGARTVFVGPWHPYIAQGLPMDFPTVGHGQNDFFIYQARAFLDQIDGIEQLPPCPDMAHGLHNLRVLEAVVSATDKPVHL
jgi:predicted dehydrogenase